MKNSDFSTTLRSGRILFLDGAMGTLLQAAGMPAGMAPDEFCLANPDILLGIHKSYVEAGANIITTCTFGANKYKLKPGADVRGINKRLAGIAAEAARAAAGDAPVFIAGDVGPTGHFAKPLGDVPPEEMIAAFAEQIAGLAAGGVDLIFMETQFDLAEVRAAVAAARRVCDLPIMASMTFEHGLSLTGSTPEIFAETMQNMGCDVVGTNCSLGPDEMLPVVAGLLAVCGCPVMAEPNAGIPELRAGETVFPLPPEPFAQKTAQFAALGAQIIGGCCGTGPDYIRALVKACQSAFQPRAQLQAQSGVALTSRSRLVRIGAGQPLALIGERINPTGKPRLAQELREGEFGEALRLADAQIAAGADVLDVNVGAPMVDEAVALPRLASLLASRCLAPLALDSSNAGAIAAALPVYPGSCLVNSISGEPGRMEELAPLCRAFGAPCILLPLQGAELPAAAAKRIAILERLLREAEDFGLARRLVLVDALALSAASTPGAGREALDVIRWCAAHDLPTAIGLSNISFGLPGRPLLNSAFLCMAAGAGLSSAIANPDAPAMAEARAAMAALLGHDKDSAQFIGAYKDWKPGGGASGSVGQAKAARTLYDAILHGDRENALPILEKELADGKDPLNLVNEVLIPAITEVGALYEKREYFLPQLIRSAEAMKIAFGRLEPLLKEAQGVEERPVIVMATVEGDIHDIGKNIVSLLLGNHGFRVIDAGKDVPAEKIVDCAVKNNARLIGLSALMTTTMARMEDTIKLVKQRRLPMKVLIGGAAVTRDFADAIGADAYCEDAVAAVSSAKALLPA